MTYWILISFVVCTIQTTLILLARKLKYKMGDTCSRNVRCADGPTVLLRTASFLRKSLKLTFRVVITYLPQQTLARQH